MSSQIDLEQELRELGQTLVVAPPPDDLAERVLVRVRAESARRRRLSTWWGWLISSRRRLVAAIVAALLIGLVLTPPVRAAVAEWLRIGGVLIKSAPPPVAPSASQEPVPTAKGVSLDRARAMVDFTLGVPDELGAPDHVSCVGRPACGVDGVGERARSDSSRPVRWQALLGLCEAGLERGHAHRRGRPRRGMDRRYPRDRLYRSGRN